MASQELLDDQKEQEQHSRSGSINEDDVYQGVARRLGWTPQDEWKRDPAKWVDARTYVEKTPDELRTLKERLKRNTQAAEHVIDDVRRRTRQEVEAELKAASEANDPARIEAAAEKLADVKADEKRPHPATLRWIERNKWFEEDPDAEAVARSAITRAAKQGLSVEEQLEEGERAVKKRFPEHFPSERRQEEDREVRLSERRAPQVAEGTRTTRTQSKDKAFSDIPQADRASYTRHFKKRYESVGLKPEEAEAKYAKAYWTNKGE